MDYNFMFSLYLILWHISIYIERNIINYLMGSSLVVALIQRPIIKEQKEKKIKRITVMHLGKNKSPEISESMMASFGGALLYI